MCKYFQPKLLAVYTYRMLSVLLIEETSHTAYSIVEFEYLYTQNGYRFRNSLVLIGHFFVHMTKYSFNKISHSFDLIYCIYAFIVI